MKKKYSIEARVTKEEKEKYQRMADKKNMTVSALIINSIESHITLNMNTSDYRDLVIQVRRIGTNINSLLRNVYYREFFTDSDIQSIKQYLKILENYILDEKKRLDGIKKGIENITPSQAKRILERNNQQVPLYMIYADVAEHINNQLLDFIEMMRDNDFEEIYIPYITLFLEKFHPTDYEHQELTNFSDELETLFYKINNSILTGYNELSEDHFDDVMEILNKYRK